MSAVPPKRRKPRVPKEPTQKEIDEVYPALEQAAAAARDFLWATQLGFKPGVTPDIALTEATLRRWMYSSHSLTKMCSKRGSFFLSLDKVPATPAQHRLMAQVNLAIILEVFMPKAVRQAFKDLTVPMPFEDGDQTAREKNFKKWIEAIQTKYLSYCAHRDEKEMRKVLFTVMVDLRTSMITAIVKARGGAIWSKEDFVEISDVDFIYHASLFQPMGPFEDRDHQERFIRLWKAHLLKHTRQLASEPALFNTYNWDTACNSIICDVVTSLVPQWCGNPPTAPLSPSKPLPTPKLAYTTVGDAASDPLFRNQSASPYLNALLPAEVNLIESPPEPILQPLARKRPMPAGFVFNAPQHNAERVTWTPSPSISPPVRRPPRQRVMVAPDSSSPPPPPGRMLPTWRVTDPPKKPVTKRFRNEDLELPLAKKRRIEPPQRSPQEVDEAHSEDAEGSEDDEPSDGGDGVTPAVVDAQIRDLQRKAEQHRPSEGVFKRKPRQGNYTSSRGQRKHYRPNPIGFWNHDDAKMHHECGLVYWWKKGISVPIEEMTEEDIIENDKFDAKQRGIEYVPRQIPVDPPPREEAGVNLPKKGKGKGKVKEGEKWQKTGREQAHASGSGSSKGQSSRDASNDAGDEERAIDELFSEEEAETQQSTRVKASSMKAKAKKSRSTKGKEKLSPGGNPTVLASTSPAGRPRHQPEQPASTRVRSPSPVDVQSVRPNIYHTGRNMSGRVKWTAEEDSCLLGALRNLHGKGQMLNPWSTILKLHGVNGTKSKTLLGRNCVQLKDRARNIAIRLHTQRKEVPEYLGFIKLPESRVGGKG